MTSLQGRLQTGLGLALAAVTLLIALLGGEAVRHVGEDLIASRLKDDAEALLGSLNWTGDATPRPDSEGVDALYRQPYSGHYYTILVADTAPVRSRSLWDTRLEIPALTAGDQRVLHMQGPAGQPLLVWVGGFEKGGRRITLGVAEDLTTLHRHLGNLRLILGAAGIALLVTLLWLQRWVLRRGLAPLGATMGQIERVASGDLAQLDESVPEEIRPLVAEFNRLLTLIEARLKRSRSAVGNLAHAIKSPLALLVQIAEGPELAGNRKIADELQSRVERIRQIVDGELRRARIAGSGGRPQPFRAADEMPDLVAVLQRIHETRGLAIEFDCRDDARLPMDRDDALELIGNLMDNACKWARRRVLTRCRDGSGVSVTVEDDGPGCDPDALNRRTRRGVRFDEDVPGSGLGLAIVRDIAEAYGAHLEFDRSPDLGGLRVRVMFSMPHRQPECRA